MVSYKDLAMATLVNIYMDLYNAYMTIEDDGITVHCLGGEDVKVADRKELVEFMEYDIRASLDSGLGLDLVKMMEERKNG